MLLTLYHPDTLKSWLSGPHSSNSSNERKKKVETFWSTCVHASWLRCVQLYFLNLIKFIVALHTKYSISYPEHDQTIFQNVPKESERMQYKTVALKLRKKIRWLKVSDQPKIDSYWQCGIAEDDSILKQTRWMVSTVRKPCPRQNLIIRFCR